MSAKEWRDSFSFKELREYREMALKVKYGILELSDANNGWLGSQITKGNVEYFDRLIRLKMIK